MGPVRRSNSDNNAALQFLSSFWMPGASWRRPASFNWHSWEVQKEPCHSAGSVGDGCCSQETGAEVIEPVAQSETDIAGLCHGQSQPDSRTSGTVNERHTTLQPIFLFICFAFLLLTPSFLSRHGNMSFETLMHKESENLDFSLRL